VTLGTYPIRTARRLPPHASSAGTNGTMAATNGGVSGPLASGLHRTSSLVESDAFQIHEDDVAELIIVCQPGLSKLMA